MTSPFESIEMECACAIKYNSVNQFSNLNLQQLSTKLIFWLHNAVTEIPLSLACRKIKKVVNLSLLGVKIRRLKSRKEINNSLGFSDQKIILFYLYSGYHLFHQKLKKLDFMNRITAVDAKLVATWQQIWWQRSLPSTFIFKFIVKCSGISFYKINKTLDCMHPLN